MTGAPPVLPDADWRHRPGLAELVTALGTGNARFVGGAVRDTLLGLAVSDVDMATVLPPQTVLERLDQAGIKGIPTGLKHGTVTAVTPGGPIEITTLRRDVATDGRHADIAYTDDWREDAARRDFTINALYADPDSGAVSDWFGGLADLNAGVVRFIGDPLARIAEDHLRILRFFRFHARFGKGAPDPAGYDACAARAKDLMALSRERIADELLKLLVAPGAVAAVRAMLARDILTPVLPEIVRVDALDRLAAREAAAGIAPHPVRRLAALIGPDEALARDIARRLRLSNAQSRRLALACTPVPAATSVAALAYLRGRDEAIDALLIGDGDVATLRQLDDWHRPALTIGGGDLIARGLKPGPLVAMTLKAIERSWIDAGFPRGAAFDAIVDTALAAATR